jgi:dTDP-glucose 4,6-dehydratase
VTDTLVITGAAGFLGSHLLDVALRWTTFDIVAVDSLRHNGASRNVRNVMNKNPDKWHRVKFIAHDLRAPFHKSDAAHLVDARYVIHAAALSQVRASIDDPAYFINNNVGGVITLLDAARSVIAPELFLLVSTDEVYGPGTPSSHTHYSPSSPYAASKACQELIAGAYRTTFSVPVTTVNISNMFGPRQSQLAFTPRVIRALLAGKSRVLVHTDRRGRPGGRHYSYVVDVAERLVSHVLDSRAEPLPERIQLPGHDYVDNEELVRRLHGIMGVELPFDSVITRTHGSHLAQLPGHDIDYATLNGDREWVPQTAFDDALRETVKWFTEYPEWLE